MNQALRWSPDNLRKAKTRLGVTTFRRGQQELIDAVMAGHDALGIMPTGGGKSLCYQLPSLFLPRAVVVISPLISLMKDQQDKLQRKAIPVAKLDSTLSAQDERDAIEEIGEGAPELIYVTPERLEQPECLTLLRDAGVSLVVVDEAHCVSQWGHDFRPAYLAIRRAVRELGRPPVLALTATATSSVAEDILTQLDIPKAKTVNIGVHRPNLIYQVRRTVNDNEKDACLTELVNDRHHDGPGIVYVATIREAKELFGRLKHSRIEVGLYHGKMPAKERHRTQQAFMEDRYRLMVATKAFGLGIDKPNLRLVVHYQLPDSLESYVQETGRAGRDGRPARAVLLYRLEDRRIQSYFLGGKYPRAEDCAMAYQTLMKLTAAGGTTLKEWTAATGLAVSKMKVIAALLEASAIVRRGRRIDTIRRFTEEAEFTRYLSEYETRAKSDRIRLDMMMKYGQTTECRVRFITRYFGNELPTSCGRCDNCRSGAAHRKVDVTTLQSGRRVAV
jgi:ATP-dependent DNA helicase RecQ